jgi:hypothetical protein
MTINQISNRDIKNLILTQNSQEELSTRRDFVTQKENYQNTKNYSNLQNNYSYQA